MKEKPKFCFNKECIFSLYLMISVISLLAQKVIIPIATDNNLMLLQTDNSNRLKTIYFGMISQY